MGKPDAEIMPFYAEAESLHRRSFELSEGLKREFPQTEVYSRFVAATGINLGTSWAKTTNTS